jgi:hypothetical protein
MNTDSERGIPVNPDQTAVEIYVQDHVAPEKGDQTFALTLDDQHVVGTGRKQMGTELEFVIMVIAVSCVKLLSAHNSTQHTSRKHKV